MFRTRYYMIDINLILYDGASNPVLFDGYWDPEGDRYRLSYFFFFNFPFISTH